MYFLHGVMRITCLLAVPTDPIISGRRNRRYFQEIFGQDGRALVRAILPSPRLSIPPYRYHLIDTPLSIVREACICNRRIEHC